jgi:hypothetical protein
MRILGTALILNGKSPFVARPITGVYLRKFRMKRVHAGDRFQTYGP